MNVESAIQRDEAVEVVVDGRTMFAGEKYTILEVGFAVYLLMEDDDEWIRTNGETLPGEPGGSRNELRSNGSMLVTSDPVLVALALNSWWHHNDKPQPVGVPLEIPSFEEAVEIVKARPILNDFNLKYAGIVPGLHRRLPGR